ncbi:MAG: ABC transporter permease [Planctomycetes bacterium]|nr:ABC transporter permease [Planctomycetota bacterium]
MSAADKEHIQEGGAGFQPAVARQAGSLPHEVVEPVPAPARIRVPLDDRLDWFALATLFRLTLRQHLHGLRLPLICSLFALGAVTAFLMRLAATTPLEVRDLELHVVLTLLPLALAPLAALLYASGMIRDEIDDRTLTYLLMRPLPRGAVYVTKLVATYLLTALLSGLFAVLTLVVVYWGQPGFWGEILPGRALQLVLLLALMLVAYCSLFGLLGLFTRSALVAGIAYIILIEGMLGGIDFAVRLATVMYYFRVLAVRWLDLRKGAWGINLAEAPGTVACVLTLLIVGVVATLLGAKKFSASEFGVKAPERS